MNKTFLLLFFLLTNNYLFSQFEIRKEPQQKNKIDSNTQNISLLNKKGYIIPHKVLDNWNAKIYMSIPLIKGGSSSYDKKADLQIREVDNSKIANKQFIITETISNVELQDYLDVKIKAFSNFQPSEVHKPDWLYTESRYLKLKDVESYQFYFIKIKDAVYTFILDSDYNNIQSKFYNKKVIITEVNKPIRELSSLENIDLNSHSVWNIETITFLSNEQFLNLILKNNSNQEIGYKLDIRNYSSIYDFLNDKEKKSIEYSTNANNDFEIALLDEYQKKNILDQEARNKIKKEIARSEAENRKNSIQKYGEHYGILVSENKIVVGMSKSMVEDSIGRPFNKSSITDKNGSTEIWKYPLGTELYFKNSTLEIIIEQNK